MRNTVVGLFDSKADARAAMEELVQKGFVKEDIDISEGTAATNSINTAATTSNTKSGNTSVGDSVSNFFSYLFGDDKTTAQNYANVAQETEAILTVQVDSPDRAEQVAQIFDNHGAIDVDERAAQSRQNFSQTSGTTGNRTANTANTANTTNTIPVIEESLRVGKRAVEGGGVRVRSRIIEKPVEETVRLRQERVVVNRRPVNREVTDADMKNFKEGDIEITEHGEQAVVGKQARVVEEISVGKKVEEHDKVVRDTVRSTDVDVQKIDGVNRTSETASDDENINTRKANS